MKMMNMYFTKNKRLMFDEHYKLLYDGETTDEQYKEICDTIPLNENGEKPTVIIVQMGSLSGKIIDLMKCMAEQVERSNKHNVYIWEDSTPENFCYAVVGTKWQSEK
jgi:hypothetical protein